MSRYKQKGIEGLSDISRRPHNIKYKKVMETYIISRLSSKGKLTTYFYYCRALDEVCSTISNLSIPSSNAS